MELETKRLIIKSNLHFEKNTDIVFPKCSNEINILDLKPRKCEDFGFAIYLKNDKKIGHVSITNSRDLFELTVGIDEPFRKQAYMSEALPECVRYIFDNSNVKEIYALVGNIVPEASKKLIEKSGFNKVTLEKRPKNEEWYVIHNKK